MKTETEHELRIRNVWEAKHGFEVLQTNEKSQTAVMRLNPGQSSGEEAEAHEESEQTLLVLEGEVFGEIDSEKKTLKVGDVIVIPAGTKHKFTNRSRKPVVTFNVYSPPEYPPGTAE